jgi:hypothetical protein
MSLFLGIGRGFALQKNTLGPEGTATEQAPSAHGSDQQAAPSVPHQGERQAAEPGHQPVQPHAGMEQPKPQQQPPQSKTPESPQGGTHAPMPGVTAHGGTGEAHTEAHGEGHGGDHVVLPELSPVAGVTFVDTLIALMDNELHGRFLGWRPNDLIIGRFTDNINNYQLGVLEAVRFTMLRLKDSLTRLGDADTYDPDLEQAVNLFMNSATLWWFPSAESSYESALQHLKKFRAKLEKGQRNFYYRRDTLVSLLATYKDLLGNVNRSLVMPVGWYEADNHFYYARGVAHVCSEILKVSRVGFKNQLTTMHGTDIMDEVLHELLIAEKINPWIVLNSDFDGFFANHRANLNAPLSEVAHLLTTLSQL